ncbi:MAG: ATP-binding protein [Elainellaceae cyanobacterium]
MHLLPSSTQPNICRPFGCCRVSLSGQFLDADPEFCNLVGYALSELLQLAVSELFFSPIMRLLSPAAQDVPHPRSIFLIGKEGQVMRAQATCLPEASGVDAEPSYLVAIEDIEFHNSKNESPSQSGLNRVIHAIYSALSASKILQATAAGCQALLPGFLGVGTYDAQGKWQWIQLAPSVEQAFADHLTRSRANSLAGYLRQGKRVKLQSSPLLAPLMSDCLQSSMGDEVVLLPPPNSLSDHHWPSQTILFIPIYAVGSLWGAILLSLSTEPRERFKPSGFMQSAPESELAIAIASHAALAIQRVQRCEELQQRSHELTQWVRHQTQHLEQALNFEAAIKRITEKIRDSLSESYIFETVIRELCETLILDRCTVGFYDPEQNTVEIRYDYATIDVCSLIDRHLEPMSDHSPVYATLREGSTIQFSTHTTSCNRLPAPYSTTLACPITDGQQVIGDLWLSRPQYSTFNESERRLVQQVTSQCAIGLRQARLYQASQAQVKSLETLGDLKDNFLSTVSHELRTPITNIKMTVKMLELTLSQQAIADPRVTQYLEILRSETQRELTLINDLLDLQRLDAGQQVLTPSEIEIEPWITQIVDGFRERARAGRQHLRLSIVTEVPSIVSDVECLKRIIAELINNACKYTPPQEFINIDVHSDDRGLQLSVSNSGVIIPRAEQERIFEKFYRGRSSDRRNQGGTGLGLALVKQIVQYLNGHISLISRDNLTSFTLKLPLLELASEATDSR